MTEPPTPSSQFPPRYENVTRVATGGYSTIHTFKNLVTNEIIVLKRVKNVEDSERQKAIDQSFEDELRAYNRLKGHCHQFIVTYRGLIPCRNVYHLVLEYCNGGTLLDLINQYNHTGDNIPDGIIWEIVASLASALSELQNLRIIHRDIKPDNILLHNERIWKLGILLFLLS
jgi:serine/threonine protein kinase